MKHVQMWLWATENGEASHIERWSNEKSPQHYHIRELRAPLILHCRDVVTESNRVQKTGTTNKMLVNITIFGVIVDILLLKQNLYVPSMWAANVYFPLDSRSPL